MYTMGGFVQQFIGEGYASAFHKPLPLRESALLRAPESEATRLARERLTKSALHVHAEEFETSMIMRWYPDVLDPEVEVENLVLGATNSPRSSIRPLKRANGESSRRPATSGILRWLQLQTGEIYALEAADIAQAIVAWLDM